ncbi:MAG: response regulator, partial [Desulfobacterales bacterium]
SISAAELQLSVTPQLFAQASTNQATASETTPEEEKALRQIYAEKIQRLEAEMNRARGTRNTLLTVAVTSFFIGAGITVGSTTIKGAREKCGLDLVLMDVRMKNISGIEALDRIKALNPDVPVVIISGGHLYFR